MISGVVVGRFKNESFVAQGRMIEDAAETFQSDIAGSDVGVAIKVGAQRHLRVIGMDDGDVFQIDGRVRVSNECFEAFGGDDIEASDVRCYKLDAVQKAGAIK